MIENSQSAARIRSERKRKPGICRDCAAPVGASSTFFCDRHFQMQKARNQKSAKQRKENGFCVSCSLPVSSFHSQIYCEKHHRSHMERRNKRIDQSKAKGICIECVEPRAANSTCYCEKHLAGCLMRATARKKQAILNGLCYSCFKVSAAPFKTCVHCRSRETARKLGIPLDLYQAKQALKQPNKEINHYAQK
jgi:hypothetical protein